MSGDYTKNTKSARCHVAANIIVKKSMIINSYVI